MNGGYLEKIIKEILKRPENKYAKNILLGNTEEKKPHSIENWLQIELAKKLYKIRGNQTVVIEKYNLDILVKPRNKSRGYWVGIELKIQGDSGNIRENIKKLSKNLKNKNISQGFLIILHFLGEIRAENWVKEFISRAPMKQLPNKYINQIEKTRPEWIEKGSNEGLVICCIKIRKN